MGGHSFREQLALPPAGAGGPTLPPGCSHPAPSSPPSRPTSWPIENSPVSVALPPPAPELVVSHAAGVCGAEALRLERLLAPLLPAPRLPWLQGVPLAGVLGAEIRERRVEGSENRRQTRLPGGLSLSPAVSPAHSGWQALT